MGTIYTRNSELILFGIRRLLALLQGSNLTLWYISGHGRNSTLDMGEAITLTNSTISVRQLVSLASAHWWGKVGFGRFGLKTLGVGT